jgi:hypothetical protein
MGPRSGIVIDWRKLLVLAAFSWATPLAAHEPVAGGGDQTKSPAQARCARPSEHDAGCRHTRGGRGMIGGVSFPPAEYPPAENFLLDTGRRAPKYLP